MPARPLRRTHSATQPPLRPSADPAPVDPLSPTPDNNPSRLIKPRHRPQSLRPAALLPYLFGQLRLTYPRLITAALTVGLLAGLFTVIPALRDTSLADFALTLPWWILFTLLLITNSPTPTRALLNCLIFFLISQSVIFLIQAFCYQDGLAIFSYHKYYFLAVLAALPLSLLGYFCLQKHNLFTAIILALLAAILATCATLDWLGVFTHFPGHFFSAILTTGFIIVITFALLPTLPLRLVPLITAAVTAAIVIIQQVTLTPTPVTAVVDLDPYSFTLSNNSEVTVINYTEITVKLKSYNTTSADGKLSSEASYYPSLSYDTSVLGPHTLRLVDSTGTTHFCALQLTSTQATILNCQ